MRRANWLPNKNSTICSRHFTKESIQVRPGAAHPLLKSDAVPTIFDFGDPDKNNSKEIESPCEQTSTKAKAKLCCKRRKQLLIREHDYSGNIQHYQRRKQLLPPGEFCLMELCNTSLDCTEQEVYPKPESSCNTTKETLDIGKKQSGSVPTIAAESSPVADSAEAVIAKAASPIRAREAIRYTTRVIENGRELDCSLREFKLQKSVRALQQKLRRLNGKVKLVNDQMYKLREEKNRYEADAKLLQSRFGGMAQEIFKNQVNNGDVSKGAERYTPAMKEFSLVLYGHSPATYEYLGTIFRLPHLSCIKAYSSSIKIPENLSLLDYYPASLERDTTREVQTYQLHISPDTYCTDDGSMCVNPVTLQDGSESISEDPIHVKYCQ